MNQNSRTRPKAAVIITMLYFAAVAVSFILMLITAADTAMSGIFLIMITAPWSLLWAWLLNLINVTAAPPVMGILLLTGGAVNGYVLYRLIAAASHKFSR